MSEHETQLGDAGSAVCHVCDRRFETHEDLSKHLIDAHPDELFSEVLGD
jgi:hypothetical protein